VSIPSSRPGSEPVRVRSATWERSAHPEGSFAGQQHYGSDRKPQRQPGMQHRPREPWNHKEITMATSMKWWNRIGELIARLLDRQSGDTAPGRLYGHGPSGMNQQPRVRWSDNSAAVIGSPRNIQEKLAAYQARGWGQQETGRSARQPEPTLSSGGSANQEPRNTRALAPSLRSSRSTWADKWQR
jgi:hypothetical protein